LSQDPCFLKTFAKKNLFWVSVAKFLVMAIIGTQTMHWGVCFLGRDLPFIATSLLGCSLMMLQQTIEKN
jgi:hypothetical protein